METTIQGLGSGAYGLGSIGFKFRVWASRFGA